MRRPGGAPRDARRRPPRDRHLVGFLALVVVVSAGYGSDLGAPAGQVVVCWTLMALLNLYFALTFRKMARLPTYPAPSRRLWWAASFAGTAYLLGDLIQIGVAVADPLTSAAAVGVGAQSMLVTMGTGAMVVGMLAARPDAASRGERTRMRLDVATVMAAATTVGLYAFDVPDGPRTLGWIFDLVARLTVAPGVFLIATYAVVKLIMSRRPPFTRAVGLTCGAACLMQGALQSVPYDDYRAGGLLPLLFAGNVVVSTMIAVGARLQWRAQPGIAPPRERATRPYSVLPYAATAAINGFLVYVLAAEGLSARTWVVIGGSLLSTGLVVWRQLLAFQNIAELLTERDILTDRLTELAFHDNLTGLANRALFMRRVGEALADETRTGELAVALVDLDDFKPVNDRYGHAAGDELLRRVGRWLTEAVRDVDTVARLGGDEFAVLVEMPPDGDPAELVERLTAALHRDTRVTDADVTVRGSVGVAVTGAAVRTADALLHEADLRMYAAKRDVRQLAGG